MDQWQERKRPVCLERRFEFGYGATRDFLDKLGDHSEATQCFPDISFGTTYVNITIRRALRMACWTASDRDRRIRRSRSMPSSAESVDLAAAYAESGVAGRAGPA